MTSGRQSSNSISEITRQDIFDWLRESDIHWAGRLSEADFLGRIFDLDSIPSSDSRHAHVSGDIGRHRYANDDWPDDWVFIDERFALMTGPDDTFLRFLCETLHPVVQEDRERTTTQAQAYNKYLRRDGWELVPGEMLSGHPIYESRRVPADGRHAVRSVTRIADALNADYLRQQVARMEHSVESDPALAIGTAKELIESVCKGILDARQETIEPGWDVPKLVKETTKTLGLLPDGIPSAAKGFDSIRRILQSLASVAGGVAELRNHYGTGHGQAPSTRGLQPRHARLATGAAATLATFLFETHLARPKQAGEDPT